MLCFCGLEVLLAEPEGLIVEALVGINGVRLQLGVLRLDGILPLLALLLADPELDPG